MRRILLAVPVLALVSLASPAQAQPGPYMRPAPNPNNPYARPIFSPWLNLANQNNLGAPGAGGAFNAGITYAGIIRPEFSYYNSIANLSQQNLSTATALSQQNQFDQLLMTGHRSVYQNLSHYYPSSRYGGMNVNPYTMRPAATVQGYQMGGFGMGGMGGMSGMSGTSAGRAPAGRR